MEWGEKKTVIVQKRLRKSFEGGREKKGGTMVQGWEEKRGEPVL